MEGRGNDLALSSVPRSLPGANFDYSGDGGVGKREGEWYNIS